MIFQTFSGYAMSQFRKIGQDQRNRGEVRWKHANLLRLLIAGAGTLKEARVPVRIEEHREQLLAIKQGQIPWQEVDLWRRDLHRDFEMALLSTDLPERLDYAAASRFLIQARRSMVLWA